MSAMQYVLIQMPSGEIKIEDNSTHIGKKRVEKFCNAGAKSAGTIESHLPTIQLRRGISHEARERYKVENAKLYSLRRFIDEL